MGLAALLTQLGLELPETAIQLTPATLVAAAVLGPVVTCLAALRPAVRSSAVRPVEAMRSATDDRARRAPRVVLAVALLAIGALGLVLGASETSGPLVGVGAAGLVLAAIVAGPLLVGPVTSALSWPLRRGGSPVTGLAHGNLVRNPPPYGVHRRALVVGLALVAGTSVVGGRCVGRRHRREEHRADPARRRGGLVEQRHAVRP